MYAVRSPQFSMGGVASINYLSKYTSYMTTISIFIKFATICGNFNYIR